MDETKARFAPGSARYDTILKELGLGGAVDDEVRRRLLWLSETRHLLVHRKGVADKKYLEKCPWGASKLGDQVTVTEGDFVLARTAVRAYVAAVSIRLEEHGHDRERPHRREALNRHLVKLRAGWRKPTAKRVSAGSPKPV